jgi:hypothetical protein
MCRGIHKRRRQKKWVGKIRECVLVMLTASYYENFQRMLLNIAESFYGNLLVLNGTIHYTSSLFSLLIYISACQSSLGFTILNIEPLEISVIEKKCV